MQIKLKLDARIKTICLLLQFIYKNLFILNFFLNLLSINFGMQTQLVSSVKCVAKHFAHNQNQGAGRVSKN